MCIGLRSSCGVQPRGGLARQGAAPVEVDLERQRQRQVCEREAQQPRAALPAQVGGGVAGAGKGSAARRPPPQLALALRPLLLGGGGGRQRAEPLLPTTTCTTRHHIYLRAATHLAAGVPLLVCCY